MTIHSIDYVAVLVFVGALAMYIVLIALWIHHDMKKKGRA